MEGSKLGYQLWIIGLYIFVTSNKGVSSLKLHRDLNVTQRTAWFMLHRIREALKLSQDELEQFGGTVEVDEAYIGGRRKCWFEDGYVDPLSDKFPIAGMKNRETNRVQVQVIDEVNEQTMWRFIKDRTHTGIKVYTDGSHVYDHLRFSAYRHEKVIHSRGEYVRGDVTTNGIESFWAMIKRGYKGVYYWMSRKHLPRYAAEFAGRHNIRSEETEDQMRMVVQMMEQKKLRYDDLTGKA